jgi:uncharacterized protein (TIGR02246 family)
VEVIVTSDEQDDAATVRDLEDQRYRAVETGDFELFARLAHPELAYTHSDGTLDDLESYLSKCREGYYVYHSIEHPIERITVAGDTAIVVGEMNAVITAGGTRKTLANRALAVWVRKAEGWRLLAFQPTVEITRSPSA